MFSEFKNFISTHSLFNESDKIIVGVSGGIDSVVMLDLISKLENQIVVAHCNFQLRGKESDEDAQFVKQLSQKYNIDFYSSSFNTEEYAQEKGISIQMAARELRYNYFEELRNILKFDLVAIAHNADDVIETVLINLSRGTGIKGLTGIPVRNGHIIRPLLFARRNAIREYLKKEQLEYREDSSNQSDKYYRNFIRHNIIPKFEELNPGFKSNLENTTGILKQTEQVYQEQILQCKKTVLTEQGGQIFIDNKKLKKFEPVEAYLYEIIAPYGFTPDNVRNLISILDGQAGKQFHSDKYTLVKDRQHTIIYKKTGFSGEYLVDETTKQITEPIDLKFELFERDVRFMIPTDQHIACLDIDKLKFPLKLRKWQNGDRFKPLGMDQFKKLSDFFSDNKFSLADKENTWIIESEGEIVWIVGYRIDNRFKITEATGKILRMEITF